MKRPRYRIRNCMRIGLTAAFLLMLIGLAACAPLASVTPAPTPRRLPTATPTRTLTPIPQLTSGIQGQVLIGPVCPGPVQEGDSGCADQPYQAAITILDKDGEVRLQLRSDAQGQFKVDLPPGIYLLRPESGKPFPQAGEQTITVLDGEYTQVVVLYDSGIR